jgi:FMN-dependent NADH-azoreductase
MNLLRVDASIQGPRSASAELADLVLTEWTTAHPGRPVVRRHLAADPLPSDAWATAVGARHIPEEQRTDAQRTALALAASLATELRTADAAVLALPLYNFGVSQHAKIWFDLAIIGGQQGERLLDGKPVVLVTTRGGAYGPGTPREGWDHNTAYLRRILVDIWGADLTIVEREFTLVGVNPALDQFTDLAAAMRATAHDQAATAAKALAAR